MKAHNFEEREEFQELIKVPNQVLQIVKAAMPKLKGRRFNYALRICWDFNSNQVGWDPNQFVAAF
jgi:hypothetical protein